MRTVTENYLAGMVAIRDGQLADALRILEAEPRDSPCYSLAQGNMGLIDSRLGRYRDAERLSRSALAEIEKVAGCPHPPSWVQFIRTLAESILAQGCESESLQVFNQAGHIADHLMQQFPEDAVAIELEKAHAFNSWGAAHLHLGNPEPARDILQGALDIYQKHESADATGLPETLTHYGQALALCGETTSAELALREALGHAEGQEHLQQVHRIKIALIDMGSDLVPGDEALAVLDQAATDAEAAGLFPTAYLRRCMAVTKSLETDETDKGLQELHKALMLEAHLDINDLNPAKLRHYQAQLFDAVGRDISEVISTIMSGTQMWFARLGRGVTESDFGVLSQKMHASFRLLSHYLIRAGRIQEAAVAFETGRALAFACEVDSSFFARLRDAASPFTGSGKINCTSLNAVQSRMASDESIVIPAIIPPAVVAFVVSRSRVEIVSVDMPSDDGLRHELLDNLRAIPHRLRERVGRRAIPDLIHTLCSRIDTARHGTKITAVAPYSVLHAVPWRLVLHEAGVSLTELPCRISFGALLFEPPQTIDWRQTETVALGYGIAEGGGTRVDLNEEAMQFVDALGKPARAAICDCRARDVTREMQHGSIVLLSCHGDFSEERNDVMFDLSDGRAASADFLPVSIEAKLVILSACESGVFRLAWGDYPVGAVPDILRRGASFCIGARYPVGAEYAREFVVTLGRLIASGLSVPEAFCASLQQMEASGKDRWRDLACFELFSRH